MKKSQPVIFALVIAFWAVVLFWGFVIGVKKSFKSSPRSENPNSSKILQTQRQKNAEIMEQQRRLTEERQQRLRDLRAK